MHTRAYMLGSSKRDIDAIAEFADSSVRATVAPAARAGSLPPIKGRTGFNEYLYSEYGNTGNAIYTAIGSFVAIGIVGAVAWWLDEPLLFPSLGATCFLAFETPMAEVSSPRNAMIGHIVGGLIAFGWLAALGITDEPTAFQQGFDAERWLAICLSLAFTGLVLRLLRAAHPPAGATTVIVALGILDTWHEMLILANGAAIVVISAGIFNRLMGVPAPLWDTPYAGLRERLYKGGGPQREGGRWIGGGPKPPPPPTPAKQPEAGPPVATGPSAGGSHQAPVVPPSGLPKQDLPPPPKKRG